VELAARTFNPRVGIVGGISVLGTSGIVEPMSENAYIESLRIELRQRRAEGARCLLVVVGNFARDFAFEALGLSSAPFVKCSNFVGAALTGASELGFRRVLLVGHIGKLVKLGLGMVNTHSSHGDGRIEALIACALEAGAGIGTLRDLAACISTDAAVAVLEAAGFFEPAMRALERRITETLGRLIPPETETGFIVFCKEGGERLGKIAAQSGNATALAAELLK
jgi:cobalt-precorrin-5B (C1)-methyltransferase